VIFCCLCYAGHSPPPPAPHNFKDERTQRQYIKLKKKLEQKHMRGDGLSIACSQVTPPISPRKGDYLLIDKYKYAGSNYIYGEVCVCVMHWLSILGVGVGGEIKIVNVLNF
jgi:hypothetical protein